MKHIFLALVACFIVLLISCGQKDSVSDTNKNEDSTKANKTMPDMTEIDGAIAGDLIVESFVANYSGNIDNKYSIVLEFIKFGSGIGGSYKYEGKSTSLKLKGSMEDTGEIRLSELNSNNEETGYFEGKMVGEQITGTWFNKKRTKQLPFTLSRTSIASLQTKSDVLSDAIGQYSLNYIVGNAGANSMFDTYLENGKWKSTSSGIVSSMREGHENELTKADLDLLNNLHIIVDDELNVHVKAGLIELVNCPFKADGLQYRVKETDKEKMGLKMAAIIPNNSFTDNHLDLLADDQIDFSNIIKGNFDIVASNNIILSYYPSERRFELDVFYGVCCDGNVLSFEKK